MTAAAMMERVCSETEYKQPNFVYTLSVVYAAGARMQEAVVTAEQARRIALENGQTGLAAAIAGQLAAFREAQERGVSPMLQVVPNEDTVQSLQGHRP